MQKTTRLALLATTMGLAATASAIANPVALTNSVVSLSSRVQIRGPADPAAIVHFQVALRLRDADTLTARNTAHQHLTPEQLEAFHLPLQADHDSVIAWLRSVGLTVDATDATRLSVAVSGRADLVTHALGVQFTDIISEGKHFVSAENNPAVPEHLAGIVLAINGLQPQLHAHYMHVLGKPLTGRPRAGSIPYVPSDLLNAYAANGQGNGTGTTTAIVIDTFPLKADLSSFWSQAGIAQSLSNITFIQAVAGTLPTQSGEESLDVEYSSSMGNASKVRVYAAQSLDNSALDTTFQRVVSDMKAGVKITQVSISLGECETDVPLGEAQTDDGYFASMTSLGASVFVSSGDSGSTECSSDGNNANVPSFYSTSPNVAAVGATTLNLNGATVTSETGWSGSGGGLSRYFASPSFQARLKAQHRVVPDLSTDGDPNTGVLVVVGGQDYQIGGTSVSSPTTAGLIGLINAKRLAAGKSTIGLLGTQIYSLVGTANFRDIKSGSNGGYTAHAGYDLVTGIGVPLLNKLSPTLVAKP